MLWFWGTCGRILFTSWLPLLMLLPLLLVGAHHPRLRNRNQFLHSLNMFQPVLQWGVAFVWNLQGGKRSATTPDRGIRDMPTALSSKIFFASGFLLWNMPVQRPRLDAVASVALVRTLLDTGQLHFCISVFAVVMILNHKSENQFKSYQLQRLLLASLDAWLTFGSSKALGSGASWQWGQRLAAKASRKLCEMYHVAATPTFSENLRESLESFGGFHNFHNAF